MLFGQYASTVISSAMADESDTAETDAIFALPLAEWIDDAQPNADDIIEEGNDSDATTTLAQRSFLPLVLK